MIGQATIDRWLLFGCGWLTGACTVGLALLALGVILT